jgi:hypothetical protein
MSKYVASDKTKIDLITRMYQDHGYTVDEICSRLRYSEELVLHIIKKCNLQPGNKSWRY